MSLGSISRQAARTDRRKNRTSRLLGRRLIVRWSFPTSGADPPQRGLPLLPQDQADIKPSRRTHHGGGASERLEGSQFTGRRAFQFSRSSVPTASGRWVRTFRSCRRDHWPAILLPDDHERNNRVAKGPLFDTSCMAPSSCVARRLPGQNPRFCDQRQTNIQTAALGRFSTHLHGGLPPRPDLWKTGRIAITARCGVVCLPRPYCRPSNARHRAASSTRRGADLHKEPTSKPRVLERRADCTTILNPWARDDQTKTLRDASRQRRGPEDRSEEDNPDKPRTGQGFVARCSTTVRQTK